MPDARSDALQQFTYLLNAMEHASQADHPDKMGYAGKRQAVLDFVASLQSATAPLPDAGAVAEKLLCDVADSGVSYDAGKYVEVQIGKHTWNLIRTWAATLEAPQPATPASASSERFVYLLNAMENAAQQDDPSKYGYGEKRKDVLRYVQDLHGMLECARESLRSETAPQPAVAGPASGALRDAVQTIIDTSSRCIVTDGAGTVHSAVKAKISDLRELAALRAGAKVPEGWVLVPRELPMEVLIDVCLSDHPDDYEQVQRTWKDCLANFAAFAAAPKQEEKP